MICKKQNRLLCLMLAVMLLMSICPLSTAAKESTVNVSGRVYTFDKNAHYDISEGTPVNDQPIGTLSLTGDLKESGTTGTYRRYVVNGESFSIAYTFDKSILNLPGTGWHITEDKTKFIDGYTLGENILSGAIVVQSSRDGKLWQTDAAFSNIFIADSAVFKEPVFKANDIQLQNGCYYRIIVAYKMEQRFDPSNIVDFNNVDYKKIANIYEFYAITGETSRAHSPADKPRKELGAVVKTEFDKGYTGSLTIDKNDPHFDMSLGTFVINGYTRETAEDGTPVFLKNVGDNVTLWFTLHQDIARLNGKDNLSISEDWNGYEVHSDPNLSIPPTNLKHGALIVRHTNAEGHTTVTPYFDFLAANARTTADTKILLREEGDYEIGLLYEIEKCDVEIGSLKVVPSYTNYKINFSFKIRNSNAMIFSFDSATEKELFDKELTTNGFKLNLAESKYLTIDVEYAILNVSREGTLTTDVRYNRAAKEGTVYTDEGIYTITAKNLYSDGEPTVKTIYVGTDRYLKAMSKGYSIQSLNSIMQDGAIIEADGTITMPSPPTEPAPTEEITLPPEPETTVMTEPTEPIETTAPQKAESDANGSMIPTIFIVAVAILAAVIILVSIKKRKSANSADLYEEDMNL